MLGLHAAERIVVAASVLIFFWGAFAFISAASLRAPWVLVPGIAMITYGWTFHSGFMNYFLSLGLGFFAAALFWRGGAGDCIKPCPTKKQKNPLDSDRPSHGRRLHSQSGSIIGW